MKLSQNAYIMGITYLQAAVQVLTCHDHVAYRESPGRA